MSLINPILPPVIDVDRAKAKELALVKSVMNNLIRTAYESFATVYPSIWENVDGLTPQQCWDVIGTDAVQFLMISQTLQGLVNTLLPGTMNFNLPEGWVLIPNQDGSVTVTHP
jgi:hypothetical protein